MTDKERRNTYHRQYYELNLEKMRQRSRDKYHRLKDNWKANLTPEKKAERHRKNYESQVRFIEKTTGRKVVRRSERQKEIVANLAEGKIDVLIGTHRLLSQDVVFKDLGLLISFLGFEKLQSKSKKSLSGVEILSRW